MSLEEKISKDLSNALKAGDKLRLETLRMVRSTIIEYKKRGLNREINNEEEISILSSAAKKRKEAIEEYQKANRPDLAEKEKIELEIISGYLPKPLSLEEITEIIQRIIVENDAHSAKDFGKIMPLVMKELKGKAEGKIVQELVKKHLNI